MTWYRKKFMIYNTTRRYAFWCNDSRILSDQISKILFIDTVYMKLHHHIIHHVRKHKERVVAHIQKHHHKYLFGAGIVSWIAVFKFVGIIAIFFGATYIGWWSLGGDYYDAEYYLQQINKDVGISTDTGIQMTTGCSITGLNLWWTTGDCPPILK